VLVGSFKTYRKKGSFGSLFFGLIFFAWAAASSTQNAKVRKATTPLPLRCPCLFWGRKKKVAEARKATTPFPLQLCRIFGVARTGNMWDNKLGSWNCLPFSNPICLT